MPKLYNQTNGDVIGDLTATQLQFLIDQLEEEDSKDKDYFINKDTLAMFRTADGDPELIAMIEGAMDEKGEVDIEWKDDLISSA